MYEGLTQDMQLTAVSQLVWLWTDFQNVPRWKRMVFVACSPKLKVIYVCVYHTGINQKAFKHTD